MDKLIAFELIAVDTLISSSHSFTFSSVHLRVFDFGGFKNSPPWFVFDLIFSLNFIFHSESYPEKSILGFYFSASVQA